MCEHISKNQPRIKKRLISPTVTGIIGVRLGFFILGIYVTKVTVKGVGTLPPIFESNLDVFRKILEDIKKYCETKGTVFDYEFN